MHTCRAALALVILGLAATARADDKPTPEGIEFFEKKVRPVLVKHCYSCHSAEAKKVKGEYRLDTRDAVLKGGTSGPSVVPGDPAKSLLITAVRHADPSLKMPPDAKLKAEEIADLEAWVKMGAPDPRTGGAAVPKIDFEKAKEFWSFRPVVRPGVPNIKAPGTNPIDAFVLAKLGAKGLKPAPPADKRTLIRRATYDLTGLPPTPEEIDAFLKDASPNAFAKVVERLLASPAYGERWGRHWLDVVRYADTAGDNSDYPFPQMYRYRNWVIDAFNRDLPYDEFVRQQLAGDLLPSKDESRPAREAHRDRLPREHQAVRLLRGRSLPVVPHLRRPDRQPRPHVPRPHDQLRPLPRPQVRPDQPDTITTRSTASSPAPATRGRASSWTRYSATSSRSRRPNRSPRSRRSGRRNWRNSTRA